MGDSNTDTLARAVLFVLFEVFFADAACGAGPVNGDVFERGAGGYAGFRVTFCGVVDVAADYAYILIHNFNEFWVCIPIPVPKKSCWKFSNMTFLIHILIYIVFKR